MKKTKHIKLPQECYICLDSIYSNKHLGKMTCSHLFHKQCIIDWYFSPQNKSQNFCPVCYTGKIIIPPKTRNKKKNRKLCCIIL